MGKGKRGRKGEGQILRAQVRGLGSYDKVLELGRFKLVSIQTIQIYLFLIYNLKVHSFHSSFISSRVACCRFYKFVP